ncbi:hypothetical protein Tco_1184382 [Tanacetum coccineum]
MGDENPICTLGDYSKPSHEGYRNTIELPEGNNVVPLQSDTIRLVQNGCSFHGLRSKDPNQHLKDFLKLLDSLDLDVANWERMRLRLFQFSLRDQASNWLERLLSAGGKFHDRNTEESLALLEDLALYENESWNDPRDFAKSVKAISLPQDVPRTVEGVDVDTLTMEQYLALSRENQAPGVVKPKIGGNVNFKIKSQFMHKLKEDTFFGNKDEDAHDHIDRVLSIVGLFNIPGVSKDAVMLRVFPFTLTGSAKRNIRSSNSIDGLTALVNKLDNLGRDMKKLKESVHAIQVGCQICEGPHLNKDYPLNEEVKQVEEIDNRPPYCEKRQRLEELLVKHQEEPTQRSTEMEGWIKKLLEYARVIITNYMARHV